MEIKALGYDFTVCKLKRLSDIRLSSDICFIGVTDEEISLVCRTENTPADTLAREDGWRGFMIMGELDFSLTGILAGISKVLSDNEIGIFAVSTYNTDYVLVKKENFDRALYALSKSGYSVI